MPDEQMIFEYVMTHQNEDFPMDQTLEEFYAKVLEWAKEVGECQMI